MFVFVFSFFCRRHLLGDSDSALLRNSPEYPQAAAGTLFKVKTKFHCSSELGRSNLVKILCGETGIRTPETLLAFTRFPGVPLQPLEHLSIRQKGVCHIFGYKVTAFLRYTQEFVHFFAFFRYFMPKRCFALAVVVSIMHSTEHL